MTTRPRDSQRKASRRGCLALVVGGAGFIGSHTVDALLASGCRVRVLDDLSTGKKENLPLSHPGLELQVGDMLDFRLVKESLQDAQWCMHLAAQVSVARSVEDPHESARRNILGFINVLRAAQEHGIQRLVYASSAAVYGDSQHLPLTEEVKPAPTSPYGLEKFVDELYGDLYMRLHRLQSVGLRYFNVYGPRQDPSSSYSGVISRFIECLRTDSQPVIFGDGRQTRDFVHVADVARANLAALQSEFRGICNVATGHRTSLLDLLHILSDARGTKTNPAFEAPRAGDIRHSCGSDARLRDQLNFVPRQSLEAGLTELAALQFSAPDTPTIPQKRKRRDRDLAETRCEPDNRAPFGQYTRID